MQPLLKGQTITKEYFSNLFDKSKTKFKKFRFHDKIDLLPHPPYSPDLSPFDFHLCPKLKSFSMAINFAQKMNQSCSLLQCWNIEELDFQDGAAPETVWQSLVIREIKFCRLRSSHLCNKVVSVLCVTSIALCIKIPLHNGVITALCKFQLASQLNL